MEEIKRCDWCGTELFKDKWGIFHCPNCGLQIANQDSKEDKNEKGGCPSYVN